MTIPTYEGFMLPLLRGIADGQEHRMRDIIPQLADTLLVPLEERRLLQPAGRSTVLYNRIQWAKTHMKKAGLLDDPLRGTVRITDEGKRVLAQNFAAIDSTFLRRYPTYVDFLGRRGLDSAYGKSGKMFDRHSEEAARNVMEKLYPDENGRRAALDLLAESMRTAHELGPQSWEVTLDPAFFRLNVGRVWMVEHADAGLHLLLRGPIHDSLQTDLLGIAVIHQSIIKRVPEAMYLEIAADQIPDLRHSEAFNTFAEVHRNAIQGAIDDRHITLWPGAHSPGVLKYMRTFLQQGLPDPELPAAQSSYDAVREVFERFHRDPVQHLGTQMRQCRAQQLRRILSDPESVTFETFHRQVWPLGKARFEGKDIGQWTAEEVPKLEEALHAGKIDFDGNFVWRPSSGVYAPNVKSNDQKLVHVRQALSILNDRSRSPREKIDALDALPGLGEATATGLVMLFHPHEIAISNGPSKGAIEKLGYPVTPLDAFEDAARTLLHRVGAEDFLELDSFLWQLDARLISIPAVEELDCSPTKSDSVDAVVSEPVFNVEYTLEQCSEGTGIRIEQIERWVWAINRKGQAILYGPPGTGKTFAATHLARHLVSGGTGIIETVQFHPAYTYEDFIEGIRPKTSEAGILSYPLVPGRFLQFCQEAEKRQGNSVLIVDEINRANLSEVFGELMYLFEYRGERIPLAAGREFQVPENVRVIGTMNTADRSIALVDFALRRRFAFLELFPNYEQLRQFHEATGFEVAGLIDTLEDLNADIGDRNYAIGISFFLDSELKTTLQNIWEMEIHPYVEEYFFDQPSKAQKYAWGAVARKIL